MAAQNVTWDMEIRRDAVFVRFWQRGKGYTQIYKNPERVGPILTKTGNRSGGGATATLNPIKHQWY